MRGRRSHTTIENQAKCLAYRDGKRCGRVARFVVEYTDQQGFHKQSVCAECKDRIIASGGTVTQASPTGFKVESAGGWSTYVARKYRTM